MAAKDGSLAGKTVFIAGGAGGLGKAIAVAGLSAGANVVVCDISQKLLAECEAELGSKGPFAAVEGDVSDEQSAAKAIESAVQKFGRLDVLVNCAAIFDKFDPVHSLDVELWNRVLAVNLTGSYIMSKCAVNHFLTQAPPSGNIVNIGSVGAMKGVAGGVGYTVSKHGLIGLTRNTAASYMKQGIRCNIVFPGGMQTNITSTALSNGYSKSGFENVQKILAMDPGFVNVNNVAKTVIHLASDASQGPNVSIISLDNGWSAF